MKKTDKTKGQTDKMILEIVNKEIEKKLTSELNYADEIKEDILKNQEENQKKPVNFDQMFGIGDYFIEKVRNLLTDTYAMKPEVRLQVGFS